MQRGHLNGSYIVPEFCEVGYSATVARAQGHNFKGYLHWGQIRNPVPILLQMCF